MSLIEKILPSVDGPRYCRVKVDGEWFTVPVSLIDAIEPRIVIPPGEGIAAAERMKPAVVHEWI